MKFAFLLFMMIVSATSFAQSQKELNQQAREGFEKADKELNDVYQQIEKEYANDKSFLKELKNAQLAWIKLRDADMKMMFPDREAGYYGTMLPQCMFTYKMTLTIERTDKLKLWLGGSEDGCYWSIK